jgi:hypothetical protein
MEFEATSESLMVYTVDITAAASHIRVLPVDTDVETDRNQLSSTCIMHPDFCTYIAVLKTVTSILRLIYP